MKPTAILGLLGLVLFVSVVSSVLTALLLAPQPAAVAREPNAGPDAAPRASEVARLEAEIQDLRRRLDANLAPAPAGVRGRLLEDAELDAAVRRVLEERLSADSSRSSEPDEEAERTAQALLRTLFALPVDDPERAKIWQQLIDEGHLDAAVAEFERRAEAAPYDSRAQTELGWAYFQKMVASESGPERGRWGAKGAGMLEKALELDDRNWDARFSLAQHYYYADMRGDSIRNLETLIAQQSSRAAEDKHARVYLLLGNLLMDADREEEAKDTWRAGLRLFPEDEALRARLAAFE